MSYCVYMHKNKINKKVYIGVTNDVKRRWRTGGIEYKPEKENTSRFYNAILKYGFENFEHIVLFDNLEKDEAFLKEIDLISQYKSTDKKFGYNISKGGNGGKVWENHPKGMKGKSQTEYQKDNQKTIMQDEKFNPMLNGSVIWGETHNHPKGMKGKNHNDDVKKQISKTVKDKKINCKRVLIEFPNGNKKYFDRKQDAAAYLKVSYPIVWKLCKTNKPYKITSTNRYAEKLKHIEGIFIKELIAC